MNDVVNHDEALLRAAQELAALEWQIELGATEAIGDEPVDRFDPPPAEVPAELPEEVAVAAPVASELAQPKPEERAAPTKPRNQPDPGIVTAQNLAAGAATLDDLRAALMHFDGCELKKGARSTIFGDGDPAAPLMIIGEPPEREEDLEGRPFTGQNGALLERMLGAIGLARAEVYITNVLPWRPPQNRDPSADEIAMIRPFLMRHIELAAPKVLVTMGNQAAKTVLDSKGGLTQLRGNWQDHNGVAVMPMAHPEALLRNPAQKRAAWADLLAIKAKLEGTNDE